MADDSVLVSVRGTAHVALGHSPFGPHRHLAHSLGREGAWEGKPVDVVRVWAGAKTNSLLVYSLPLPFPLLFPFPLAAAAVPPNPSHPGPPAALFRCLHPGPAFAGRCSIAPVPAVRDQRQGPPQRALCTAWYLLPAPPPLPAGDDRPRESLHGGNKGRH